MEIGRHCAALPLIDRRPADEILRERAARMIIDTSVLIAMLEQEPEAERIARALAATPERSLSGLACSPVGDERMPRKNARLRANLRNDAAGDDPVLAFCISVSRGAASIVGQKFTIESSFHEELAFAFYCIHSGWIQLANGTQLAQYVFGNGLIGRRVTDRCAPALRQREV